MTFPQGTKYIYGLNFYDGDIGLQQTLDEAIPAWKALGDNIYAFEIGNEVDGMCVLYPCYLLAENIHEMQKRDR
jgi:hypothetical protein